MQRALETDQDRPGRRGTRGWRAVALAAAVLAVLAPAPQAQVKLPDIGESSGGALSGPEERQLGEAFLREIRAHLVLVEDQEIVDYVRSVGDRLAEASGERELGFRFFVVDAPTVNAFAGPGGIIAVNTGLLTLTRNESELAAVLAHELAHVTQRHLARAVQSAGRAALPQLAGILAALVLATQNADAGQAAMAAVLAGSAQRSIDFTRQNELEADRVGTTILAEAQFDPRAMPTFFEQMLLSHRYDTEPPEFLSTHPVTINRIADSRARAEQYPYRQFADSDTYHLVKAKIQALSAKDPAEPIATFRAALQTGQHRSEIGTRYGLAIALIRARQWQEAKEQVTWLLERAPDRVSFLAAQAEVERGLGDDGRALALYQEALRNYPNNALLVRAYARALLLAGRNEEALSVLEEYVKSERPTSDLHRLLAEAYARVGRHLESNLALAELHYDLGNLTAAVRQLSVALREYGTRGGHAAARVQARLEELEAERKLLARG